MLGLSSEQLAQRSLRLHAGDASDLLAGRWCALWRRKKGLDPEPDLSDEFHVQLGLLTEPFNLAWTDRQTGRQIAYFSANGLLQKIWFKLTGRPGSADELAVSSSFGWMACNLDGMTTTPKGQWCPIDAKHVAKMNDTTIERYTAAGTWQATVMECDWWALSVVAGNKWTGAYFQPVDPMFQAELIDRGREFWRFIEKDEEPPDIEPELPPKPVPQLRRITVPVIENESFRRLVAENNWLPAALKELRIFADTKPAADRHAIARKAIGEALPEDVGLLQYGLVAAKRDRRGLTISLAKDNKNET